MIRDITAHIRGILANPDATPDELREALRLAAAEVEHYRHLAEVAEEGRLGKTYAIFVEGKRGPTVTTSDDGFDAQEALRMICGYLYALGLQVPENADARREALKVAAEEARVRGAAEAFGSVAHVLGKGAVQQVFEALRKA